jgi:hypothetical protein
MRRSIRKRKCLHCKRLFDPHPRSAGRQRYCSASACRKASKITSQRRWRQKPANRDYFKGPHHVQRVQQWRQDNPGYWRRKPSEPADALQDSLTPQPLADQLLEHDLKHDALQDSFFMQPAVFVGLIAQLTGLALQDDIALAARRWQQLGNDILKGLAPQSGDLCDDQTSHLTGQAQASAQPVQLGRPSLGP